MNKYIKILIGAVILAAFSFCIYFFVMKKGDESAVSAIDQAFQVQMIGSNITHLEQTIGLAQSSLGDVNTYQLEGCELEVTHHNANITAMTLIIMPTCSFDLQNILQEQGKLMAHTLSFGSFNQTIGQSGVFYADCLEMCGNAYDLSVYLHQAGSRSNGFIEIMLSSTQYDSDSASKIAQLMTAQKGDDWVSDNQFNCYPYEYREILAQEFNHAPVQKITIGYDLLETLGVTNGCE